VANKFSVSCNHPSGSARILEKSAALAVSSVEVGAPSSGASCSLADSAVTVLGVSSEVFEEEEIDASSFTCGGGCRGLDSESFSSIDSVEITRLVEFNPLGIGGILVWFVVGSVVAESS